MPVRELDDAAEDEKESEGADDEAGERGCHIGATRGVRRLSVGMRVSHGEYRCAFVRRRARC